jgi:shikimate dehydrogenase
VEIYPGFSADARVDLGEEGARYVKEGDPSPLPKPAIEARHFVYDTIYSRRTQLIGDAEETGARCANGLSMLLHQGALAFEIWLQRPAPVEVMSTALKAATGLK